MNRRWLFPVLLLAGLIACARTDCSRHREPSPAVQIGFSRDWKSHPAVAERETLAEIVAVGDIHGGYERLVKLLLTGGLILPDSGSSVGYSWSGGPRIFVCTGDVIDKGDRSLDVIDLLSALEPQARANGGEVIVLLGNHEVSFLADPNQKKVRVFRDELLRRGIDPHGVSRGEGPGRWLLDRPVAARVNDWFFSHAGDTGGKTILQIARVFQNAFEQTDWRSPLLLGPESLLEARDWWKEDDATRIDAYLEALNVRHLVIGHEPSHNGQIRVKGGGRLFMIDTGMSPAIGYGEGALLIVDAAMKRESAASLGTDGTRVELWSGELPAPAPRQ